MNMKKKKLTLGKTVCYLVLLFACLSCVIPIITVVSISFSNDMKIIKEGYGILPNGFTLDAYKYVLKDFGTILRSYGVSIVVTVTGCVLGLMVNSLVAYVLSRKDYVFHKQLSIFVLIPMLVSGGIVPSYILIAR